MQNINLSEEDKIRLLESLNKKGFILEKRLNKILGSCEFIKNIKRNIPYKFKNESGEINQGEVDVIADFNDSKTPISKKVIFECKKTDYTWLFPKELLEVDFIYLFQRRDTGFWINSVIARARISTDSDSTLMLSSNGKLLRDNNKQPVREAHEDVRKGVRDTLRSFEFIMNTSKQVNCDFYPILVTNTELLVMKYSGNHITTDGNLEDYTSINTQPYIFYNYPKKLLWDNWSQDFKYTGIGNASNWMKSVIIVNINHINDLLRDLQRF